MQKTPRNQEPAYTAPYDEVVAAGHEAYPPFPSYDRKYDKYDTYYKIPTRQTTCHDGKFLGKRLENSDNVQLRIDTRDNSNDRRQKPMPKLQIETALEPLNRPPLFPQKNPPARVRRDTATSSKTHQSSSAEMNSSSLLDGADDPTSSTLRCTKSSKRSRRRQDWWALRARRALETLSERATRAASSSSGL